MSLHVRRGETLGITGLLGAGRTELALTLFGMRGPIRLRHARRQPVLDLRSNRDAIRLASPICRRIGCRSASSSRNRSRTTLSSPRSTRSSSGGLIRTGKTVRWSPAGSAIWRSRSDGRRTRSRRYPGGNQQRVAIAKWLAIGLKLLILDSPTVGVDVGARAGIFEIVVEARPKAWRSC